MNFTMLHMLSYVELPTCGYSAWSAGKTLDIFVDRHIDDCTMIHKPLAERTEIPADKHNDSFVSY